MNRRASIKQHPFAQRGSRRYQRMLHNIKAAPNCSERTNNRRWSNDRCEYPSPPPKLHGQVPT